MSTPKIEIKKDPRHKKWRGSSTRECKVTRRSKTQTGIAADDGSIPSTSTKKAAAYKFVASSTITKSKRLQNQCPVASDSGELGYLMNIDSEQKPNTIKP
jgi:hypothetical protein